MKNLLLTLFMFLAFVLVLWEGSFVILALLTLFCIISTALYMWNVENEHKKAKGTENQFKQYISLASEPIAEVKLDIPCDITLPIQEQIEWFYEHGRFFLCNQALADSFGYASPDDLIGKKLGEGIPRSKTSNTFMTAFITSNYRAKDIETMEKMPDGRIEYTSRSLFGDVRDGKLHGTWGMRRDITARKLDAIEKEKLLIETESAKREAEMACKERDRFLANISHELRTPLVAVLGYSDLLDENASKEQYMDAMKIINRNAKLQLGLIDELLDASKSLARKITLEKTEFDLGQTIRDTVESFRIKAEGKGLIIEGCKGNLKVFADQKRIVQILNNLISNAIKFTDKGKVTVKCNKTNDNFVIKVIDTGIGMTPSDVRSIFKAFTQLDETKAKKHVGFGLGLSIVRGLVDVHGGKIKVKSEIGKGSEFTVSIPSTLKENSVAGLHILLAEDAIDIGNLVKAFLEKNGAVVYWAKDAKEAYDVACSEVFDVFLFDIAMPGEDGIRLLKRIRDDGDKTPAVAISAYSSYSELALNNHFSMFMEKPVSWENLLSIASLVNKK